MLQDTYITSYMIIFEIRDICVRQLVAITYVLLVYL